MRKSHLYTMREIACKIRQSYELTDAARDLARAIDEATYNRPEAIAAATARLQSAADAMKALADKATAELARVEHWEY